MTTARFPALALGVAWTAAGLLPAQDDGPKTHLLRYHFEKGASGHYVVADSSNMKMAAGPRPMEATMSKQMFMEFRIVDVVDGVAHVQHEFHRVKMTVNDPMRGVMEFDTDDEDSMPGMLDHILDMVGQPWEVEVDALGKVELVRVPEVLKSPKALQTGINLEEMASHFMAELPDEPIAIGDSWKTSFSQSSQMGDMVVEIDNKLVAVDETSATIEQTMTMEVDAKGSPLPLETDVKKATGKVVLDLRQGMPRDLSMSMEIGLKTEGGPMPVDMQVKKDVSMKRTAPPAETKAPEKGQD